MTSTRSDHGFLPGYLPPDMPRDARVIPRRRSLGGLATALHVLLPLSALVGLLSGYASFHRAGLLDDVLAGRRIDLAAASTADSFVSVSAIADLGLYIPAGVVFIIWFWRLAKNAALLDAYQAPKAGWAIGSWFVPLGNYWLPALNLIRADRVSGRLVDRDTTGSRRLIIGWAITFGLSIAVSTALWRTAPHHLLTRDDLRAFARADRYDLVSQIGYAIAAVLAILVIRRLTERQDLAMIDEDSAQLADELRRASFVAPPGFSAPISPSGSALASPADPLAPVVPLERGTP